uniref:DUF4394 domain-containing protein n=1 Tax=Marinobacter nauticus TaxID=2743 RepID=A0A455WHF7_MARNT|nr:hypothetical protein YBY_39040 [Marinobacter nauticus]
MNNKFMTVSVLSAAVALAGCNSSSGGGAANMPFQCNAEADLSALTANDVLAVTADNACLVRFSLSDPSTVLAVGSLDVAGSVVGLDFRPASGELYALTDMGQLVLVDPMTAETTLVTASIGELTGARYDIDFNPAANALRLISDARQNFRMGSPALVENAQQQALVDGTFGYLQGVVATAYTNVNPGQEGTQMFVISADSRTFFQQNPNVGLLTRIGGLFPSAESVDVKGYNVFTTEGGMNEHYAVFEVDGSVGLYSINPATAATTLIKPLPAPEAGGNYMDLVVNDVTDEPALREFIVFEQSADDDFVLRIVELNPADSMPGMALAGYDETLPVTGLVEGDVIVGFDLRTTSPEGADDGLYAVAQSGRIYLLEESDPIILTPEAQATEIATLATDLSGTRFDIDFNPRADLLRIIGDAGQNLRVNLDEDRVLADEARAAGFAFADGTVRLGDTMVPAPVAVAYRAAPMQLEGVIPSLDFQYVIDARNSGLARVAVPNDGALVAVGDGLLEGLVLPTDGAIQQTMDIAQSGTAYAALRTSAGAGSMLYTLNLLAGTAEQVGPIGGTANPVAVNAMSVVIPEPVVMEAGR